MVSPEMSALAAVTYTAIHASFTATTVIALVLHLVGRHENCVRNLFISVVLAASALLSSGMKTYFTAQPATETVEATAYLTMLLTPFALVASKLATLNNQAAKITRNTPDTRQAYIWSSGGILDDANVADVPRAGQVEPNKPKPPVADAVQVTGPGPPQSLTQPAPSPRHTPTAVRAETPTVLHRPQADAAKGRDISRHGGFSRKTPAGESRPQKSQPSIDDVIASATHWRLLERLTIKQLARGVRYNKKLFTMKLNHLRHQDMLYIWQLGRSAKPDMTERSKTRLKGLRVITINRKAVAKKNRIEVVEEIKLTEKGWAVREALARAAHEILKKTARKDVSYAV